MSGFLARLFRKKKDDEEAMAALDAFSGFRSAMETDRETMQFAVQNPEIAVKDMLDADMPEVFILGFIDGVAVRDEIEKQYVKHLAQNNFELRKKEKQQ